MKGDILYLANVLVEERDAATNFVAESFYNEHKGQKGWNCRKVMVLDDDE